MFKLSYPWTDVDKKLQERLKASETETPVRVECVETWFEEIKNRKIPWWESVWIDVTHWWHLATWAVYRWFRPCHQPVRAAVPRKWMDCTELILEVNFAIIKEFVENEMDSVSWDDKDRPETMVAGQWLRNSYEYITKGRALLQDAYSKALREASDLPLEVRKAMTYEQKYGASNKIKAEIDERDKQVLLGLAEYRQWMWT